MRYLIIAVIAYHIIGAIAWLFTEHKPAKTIAQIEREQRGILREQERQCREVERLARKQMLEEKERLKLAEEQEKQAAQIAKHEQQLMKLEQKLELAERDEEHWDSKTTEIRIDIKYMQALIDHYKSHGLPCAGLEEKLKKRSDDLYKAETNQIKARHARELCEKQISAM